MLVTKEGERFRILAGERRVRAARLAGLSEVPVVVREGVTDRDHLLLALVENVQRRDLTALEEAEAYRHLKDDFSLTQEDVAERVGKDRATVANALRLLKLPAAVRAALEDGSLTAGHARALLALPSAADQEPLAKEVVRRGLSVRAIEARVASRSQKGSAKKKKTRAVDADTRDAELRLARALGTRVEIRRKKRGGEVRIAFYSEEELIGSLRAAAAEGARHEREKGRRHAERVPRPRRAAGGDALVRRRFPDRRRSSRARSRRTPSSWSERAASSRARSGSGASRSPARSRGASTPRSASSCTPARASSPTSRRPTLVVEEGAVIQGPVESGPPRAEEPEKHAP